MTEGFDKISAILPQISLGILNLGALESSREGMNQWTIIQRVEMGRPSSLQLKFQKNNRSITEVSVGGASVLVCQGQMIIPDGETKSGIKRSL
ncbi:MAG: hypothetical protein EWV53_21375 [Microcystis panniformis Mp_MB_F_20051200_S9]|uniref:PhzF family phenazine biosynthesis protein n=1 Tax=Microcystis panniformis Mp_MB_F_20051200_S9 TaxID=2486223 RepID=A0A552PJQ5_9CHRO|nr:MAG: hypothetical protein EWV87_20205 [Microcystis panniformis Mp_GB_SS_20050300_S99]TRV47106.1 MAG: hypothetical protein EWV42_16910 [Microcystis panniformis Mp_GB_SS_20050300_S99D]TRV49834.1 MAG: hypothetical protein EWV43_07540 [Microcystis panniformis Mp_MB_F_20080800_S26D]TRV57203.1 MAG: hypothetical protein EWV53_21375 [Microcystis panniformis Mp_MB_F_20051200_S9]TRV58181.1 MAG: hypothetical protein EWV69_14525 [Microcystis panniformis Mp_MB_F_20080800_S26]TRV68660.1 MAG: hypothetical